MVNVKEIRKKTPFMQLGAEIFDMSQFIKDMHNVLQAVKSIVRPIRFLYNWSAEEERNPEEKPKSVIPTESRQLAAVHVILNRKAFDQVKGCATERENFWGINRGLEPKFRREQKCTHSANVG